MQDHDIDTVCLAERHTNWKYYKEIRQLNRIVQNNWKRRHIIVSNIDNTLKTHYQSGGTSIITTNILSPRTTESGEALHGMERWSYITINGRNKTI